MFRSKPKPAVPSPSQVTPGPLPNTSEGTIIGFAYKREGWEFYQYSKNRPGGNLSEVIELVDRAHHVPARPGLLSRTDDLIEQMEAHLEVTRAYLELMVADPQILSSTIGREASNYMTSQRKLVSRMKTMKSKEKDT